MANMDMQWTKLKSYEFECYASYLSHGVWTFTSSTQIYIIQFLYACAELIYNSEVAKSQHIF